MKFIITVKAKHILIHGFAVFVLFICSALNAKEFAVIANPALASNIDSTFIQRAYLGKLKSFANGESIEPIDYDSKGEIKTAFTKTFLKKSPSQIKAYWAKLVFTGKGTPPNMLSSSSDIKEFVASTPGAIAYLPLSDVDDSVKVVMEF